LKLSLSLFVSWIYIRVIFLGKLTVGAFYCRLVCSPVYAQDFIVISFICHWSFPFLHTSMGCSKTPHAFFGDTHGLYFSVFSVYYIVAVCFIAIVLWTCACSRIWSCLLSVLCLLIHLCEEFLSALHQFFFSVLQFLYLSICDLVS